MKALIPAAGLGTRLRPLTYTRPKPVLRVAGKPLIAHAVHTLLAAGIRDIGVIVSDVTRDDILYALRFETEARITPILQPEMKGLGHAVLMGREFVGDDDFCVYLGDNLFEEGAASLAARFREERPDALIALAEVEDPTAFGVAELEGERIVRLVEKPQVPPSNFAVAGLYFFRSGFFEVLGEQAPSARGEIEITDAIQGLIEGGRTVLGARLQGWWKDTGKPGDLLDANRLLLERIEPCSQGETEDCDISGRVYVSPGAVLRGCRIVGPVFIGRDVIVEDAYLGPFTSVGNRSQIRRAEIEHSVLDSEVVIEDVPRRLQDCLIGRRAVVRGGERRPNAHRLILSDAAQVDLA